MPLRSQGTEQNGPDWHPLAISASELQRVRTAELVSHGLWDKPSGTLGSIACAGLKTSLWTLDEA
jgi:hypothetical protein